MLTKTKSLILTLIVGVSLGGGASLAMASVAYAAPNDDNPNDNTSKCADGACRDPAADPDADCTNDRCDLIKKYVNPTIKLLSISFGLIAVISIIMGGIQYAGSTGDPQKVTQAKQRIFKTIIAIVAYFFLYAFLQFLVPGGAFR